MAIVAVILWEHQPRKTDGKFPIRIRITHQRKTTYETIGYTHKRHWNEKQGRVTSHDPLGNEINRELNRRKAEVEALLAWHEENRLEFTGQQILGINFENWKQDQGKAVLETAIPKVDYAHFLSYAQNLNQQLMMAGNSKRYRYYERERVMFSKFLEGVKNRKDIKIAEMDENLILEYFSWCKTARLNTGKVVFIRQKYKLKANANSTLLTRLIFINRVINHAHRKGIIFRKPFDTRNITRQIKPEKRTKVKLTREEVLLIEEAELHSFKAITGVVRDAWVLQFYLYGTRISDVLNLRNGWIVYVEELQTMVIEFHQLKTDSKFVVQITNPKVIELIRHYQNTDDPDGFLLPLLTWRHDPLLSKDENIDRLERDIDAKTSRMNYHLKKVTDRVGIEKNVTTHVSRHSVAYQAQKARVPLDVLQKAFRHSTIGMTANYMKELGADEVADAMKSIYE